MGDYGNYDLDRIYTKQTHPLGCKVEDQAGRVFQYVKYNDGDGDVDAVAGQLGVGLDSAFPAHELTMDYDSATVPAMAASVGGFFQAALTHGTFGWVQVHGPNRIAALTDGGVAQGERLMKHATTDGGIDTHDDTAAKVLGVALEDDTGTALGVGEMFITIETK